VKITFNGETIASITENGDDSPGRESRVAPGLIDLQVNGHAGLDFKECAGKIGEIRGAIRHLWSGGTAYCLPTLITGRRAETTASLHSLEQVRREQPEGVSILGYHLEGPYISPEDGYRGAHPKELCRPPDRAEFREWWEASGHNIKIVSLAPEWPGAIEFIQYVRSLGVRAAIAHSRAEQPRIAAAGLAGADLSVHLGNGIPRILARHPNVVWEQLARDELWASVIMDGEHLDASTFSGFMKVKGEKIFLVSDASRWAGAQPGEYQFAGRAIRVEENGRLYFTDNGGLLGSGRYLHQCVSFLVGSFPMDEKMAVEMASLRPAKYMGLDDRLGKFEPGKEATFILYRWTESGMMEVRETWIKGKCVYKNSGEVE
jgi:N-acetylglucosamine-6-phosphate deacetylase